MDLGDSPRSDFLASYEETPRAINRFIVGRAITGGSAFG
jgi:hypothetical protein